MAAAGTDATQSCTFLLDVTSHYTRYSARYCPCFIVVQFAQCLLLFASYLNAHLMSLFIKGLFFNDGATSIGSQ